MQKSIRTVMADLDEELDKVEPIKERDNNDK
jgi:hypothetical protein